MATTGKYYFLSRPRRFGITPKYEDFGTRFNDVIDATCEKTGRQVVILIDEYDKPIVNNLGNEPLVDYYRKTLQGFYGVIKSKGDQTRFCLLTGVSKIGKLSVFSTLNNLTDISLDAEYSDICGISEADLHTYFEESVATQPTPPFSRLRKRATQDHS